VITEAVQAHGYSQKEVADYLKLHYCTISRILAKSEKRSRVKVPPRIRNRGVIKKMIFDSFLSDVLATLLGGVVLALMFFWAREKLFPLPNISGRWYFEAKTINTSYNPYSGMVLRYVAMLWREDQIIHGTIEKIHEKSSAGECSYVGKARTRGIVDGYVQKNYFSSDKVYLHIIENGHGRESTHFYELRVATNELSGTFSSMVAETDGITIWQRNCFKDS